MGQSYTNIHLDFRLFSVFLISFGGSLVGTFTAFLPGSMSD